MKQRTAKTASISCIFLVFFLCAATSLVPLVSAVETQTVTVGGSPYAVAITPDGKYAYVPNGENVSVIDTATNKVTATVTAQNWAPYAVAITPDGKYAYVTNVVSSEVPNGVVSVIDLASNTVTATIAVGEQLHGYSTGSLFRDAAV